MRRGVTPQWPRPHKVFNPQWPHPPLTPSPDSPQWPVCPSPMGLPPALLLVLCLYPAPQGLAPPDPGLLAQGRARLREAQTLAQHPQLGACWAGALGRLDGGCQQLGEEQQSRIALAFAHCHLQRSGRPFPRCEASSSVRACTQHMDPVAFGVYTEFFTHAHSICYLLRSEAWQQQAESTVHRLVASSEGVAERLEETNQLAEQAARAQEATLRSQEEILRHGELLRQTLQDSSRGVREAFRDMQEAAGRQRLAFAEIVNRLSFLHRFLVGESQALGSFLYHLLTSSAALLLTSSQRTAGARLILLGLVGGNVYLERVVSGLVLENTEAGSDPTEALASWVGLCRRLCVGAGLAVLAYCVLTYRDVAQQSREVLRGLQETRAQMQHILQETERLLAQRGPDPSQDNAEFADSGFPEPLSRPERGAPWAEELSTSSPKSRSRSPARQRPRPQRRTSRRDSERRNVPVPVDGLGCYDLRRRPALRDPPQTPATVKGPLCSARRGRTQLPAAGAILLSPTWDQTPTA
ncbi:uncharacterized protein LOC119564925 isoform X4 [Chelonia mydas]|uniref:uncharacterized protein LOC119564925 isoform X4 n=1 Tax=Chelonia mydas TaxID=8469 RepID=UPI001CA8DFB4|nr:uncharacterized protein LOC119564925 isoform X4 [Chelonia mydas]